MIFWMSSADLRRRNAVRSAVDSSVLLDVLLPDPVFGQASAAALRRAIDSGAVIACEIVWAEVRASFPNDTVFLQAFDRLQVEFDAVRREASQMDGSVMAQCLAAARGRNHVDLVPDVIVGAGAAF